MKQIWFYDTDIGPVGIAADGEAVTDLRFGREVPKGEYEVQETALAAEAAKQLREYLDGNRRVFDLPLAPQGTPFQQSVWRALCEIPYGETTTYSDIAKRIGRPTAVRAVGGANNRNPISVFIPCHRVVGADGSLTGYGGGLPVKEKLLGLEGSLLG